MGNEAQFRSMVSTCRKAGVKVYVDAVINHMTGQGDTSYGGVKYQRYDYAGLTARATSTSTPATARRPPAASRTSTTCSRSSTASSSASRTCAPTRASYGPGWRRTSTSCSATASPGFRVDAAKHIGQADLDAIYARLHDTKDGTRPYWALEVFGGGPGRLAPDAFVRSGVVLGLDGVKQLKSAFKSYPTDAAGSIATLRGLRRGLRPDAEPQTLSFVQNHDTERNGDALNYKDGATNRLATQYLLAAGYGRPQVYSAFNFTTDGRLAAGHRRRDDHRRRRAAPAGPARTATRASPRWSAGTTAWALPPQAHWWDDGANVIAFSRGDRGWVAMNNNTVAKTVRVQTGLAPRPLLRRGHRWPQLLGHRGRRQRQRRRPGDGAGQGHGRRARRQPPLAQDPSGPAVHRSTGAASPSSSPVCTTDAGPARLR